MPWIFCIAVPKHRAKLVWKRSFYLLLVKNACKHILYDGYSYQEHQLGLVIETLWWILALNRLKISIFFLNLGTVSPGQVYRLKKLHPWLTESHTPLQKMFKLKLWVWASSKIKSSFSLQLWREKAWDKRRVFVCSGDLLPDSANREFYPLLSYIRLWAKSYFSQFDFFPYFPKGN